MLTPLPTYNPYVVEDCQALEDNIGQNMLVQTPVLEANSFHVPGCLTPVTPEPVVYHDQSFVGTSSEPWIAAHAWPEDLMTSVGLGLDGSLTAMCHTGLWNVQGPLYNVPITPMPWNQHSLSDSPQQISCEFLPHAEVITSLPTGNFSMDSFNASGIYEDSWSGCEMTTPGTTFMEMASYLNSHGSNRNITHAWENVVSAP
jgi:hypothetical protein